MAKFHDMGIADIELKSSDDYSASKWRYCFVTLGGSADVCGSATGASSPWPIGVLQNCPCAGEAAQVRLYGFSKLRVSCATCIIKPGSKLLCNSGSAWGEQLEYANAWATCAYSAIAMEAVSSGCAIIEVLLVPFGVSGPAAC